MSSWWCNRLQVEAPSHSCHQLDRSRVFVAAIHATKLAKYLHAVLFEFGVPQEGPMPLYEDNISAITMINERKPTSNSRHIDIQYFTIQEWRHRGIIVMHHLPSIINVADQATKALSWTLHSHHAH
jgi:hypothetical protein